jgi:hypothetical protein
MAARMKHTTPDGSTSGCRPSAEPQYDLLHVNREVGDGEAEEFYWCPLAPISLLMRLFFG